MLLNLLRADVALNRYISLTCNENGVSVEIDKTIDPNNLVIIKVDRYYNHLIKDPDKSPDCLVIQRCDDGNYIIYIIELRNIRRQDGFKVDDIKEKFITCLDDFMSNKFANYFHNPLFNFLSIHLVFVSDPYSYKLNPERQTKLRGHKLDALIAQRIPKYFGKHLYINHKLPNPTIKPCPK